MRNAIAASVISGLILAALGGAWQVYGMIDAMDKRVALLEYWASWHGFNQPHRKEVR